MGGAEAHRVGVHGRCLLVIATTTAVGTTKVWMHTVDSWVQEDDCNWGGTGRGGGEANPFILLHM